MVKCISNIKTRNLVIHLFLYAYLKSSKSKDPICKIIDVINPCHSKYFYSGVRFPKASVNNLDSSANSVVWFP